MNIQNLIEWREKMEIIQNILKFLDSKMVKPEPYGAFHLAFFAASILAAVLLCFLWKKGIIKDVKRVVFITALIVIILEIYKLINFSFGYTDGITFNFQWYAFPWQFCSTPMIVGLLAGMSKGKIHHNLCAYLATYALFAGTAVMFYPTTVFVDTIGINIQTMICHGSMITVAIFLYFTGYVKAEKGTILKALPIFIIAVSIALSFNEIAYQTGLLETHTFNMFFFNPHLDSDLPVYSLIHNALREWLFPLGFIISLILYIGGFTAAAFIMLLIPVGIKKFADTDFDADYAEEDAARNEMEIKHMEKQIEDLQKKIAEKRPVEAKVEDSDSGEETPV